jgi:hypothetical protein
MDTSNEGNDNLSPEEKLQVVWKKLLEERKSDTAACPKQWPTYNEVLNDVRKTDYEEILTCPLDIHPGKHTDNRQKKICPQGVICCAKLELFPQHPKVARPYTGLLAPGSTVEHCLVRLSSALQPMAPESTNRMARMMLGHKLTNAKIFPAVAIKVFRQNVASGNALFLGCKVGQVEDDFFAHCVCTQLSKRMPRTLRPVVNLFGKYSDHPLALGLSDFCAYDSNGTVSDDHGFPFCMTLSPASKSKIKSSETVVAAKTQAKKGEKQVEKLDSFLDDILDIPVGTVLYDIFASPDPLSVGDGKKLQRIGRIVTTSEMIESAPDDGIFFRHQRKDEDLQLRPHWKDDLATKVVLKDGTKGTAANLAGWELFEHLIQDGGYMDYEKA